MKKTPSLTRRGFLAGSACALSLGPASAQGTWRPLFDGKTFDGWRAIHRLPVPRNPGGPPPSKDSPRYQKALRSKGDWRVVDGAITGGQEPPGSGVGGYLITDEKFADFELSIEANPDWGVGTGVMIRATASQAKAFKSLWTTARAATSVLFTATASEGSTATSSGSQPRTTRWARSLA